MSEALLTFTDAGVQRDGRWIWRHVSLHVGSGEFVAVLGPNGSGKSTLIKAVLGTQGLAEGTVTVAGDGARRIGYLPQRRHFDPDLRIRGRDIVRLGLDGTRWGVPVPFTRHSREVRRRVDAVAEQTGATALLPKSIGDLSGGEQQRLLITQALVSGPALLLLDEPLDSLDITNQHAISALVQSICRDTKCTVLLVAHDVNPIMPYLDSVIYVAGGQALAGQPKTVITSETLSRLYGSPIDVLTATDGRLVVVGQPEAPSFHAHDH